jgi:membrane protein DedA with SNARE-associated domain
MAHTLFSLLEAAAGNPLLTGLVIVAATAIIEDPTTILVGILSASGFIPVPLALVSLYIGIVVGDTALFGLGALARTRPQLAAYVDHELVVPLRTWLETRFILTVFSVRFIPGMRVPTYTASGFFKQPFAVFVTTAIAATFVWTTLLFSASYWFGTLTHEWFASARWGIAVAVLLILFLVARHNVARLNRKKPLEKN